MKRQSAVALTGLLLIPLSACSTEANPHDQTLDACKSKIIEQTQAEEQDWTGLKVDDLPEALAKSGIPDPDGDAEGMITVYGEVTLDDSSFNVLCTADYVDGEAVVVAAHPILTANS